MRQIPARRWLGLTATPYRRDQLDDLIALQLGPVRHGYAAVHRDLAADGARTRQVVDDIVAAIGPIRDRPARLGS